jgi:mRNA-degrading endonuclease toxin of MazEF toxin-antitoxin module
MPRVSRGDIVRAEDEEGRFTAVIIQTDMFAGSTVIVCPITRHATGAADVHRVPLRRGLSGVGRPAVVLIAIAQAVGLDMPAELASAITTMLAFAVSWIVRERTD